MVISIDCLLHTVLTRLRCIYLCFLFLHQSFKDKKYGAFSFFYLMHYIFFGLFSYSYPLSVTVLTLWMAPPKMFYNNYISIGFDEAKTSCGIIQVLGILL